VLPPICPVCGRSTNSAVVCPSCRQLPLAINGIRSVVVLENAARQAIHRFKYGNRPSLAAPLASLMADYWAASPLPADLIVAVPLHVARQRERGYNQAHLLARSLGQVVGLPLATNTLRRTRHTRVQVGLDALQRQINVRDAFACRVPARGEVSGQHRTTVEGRHILLVDDVCTTGATLDACTIALREAGAARVWGFTLAHPR
jgi:ComF family protein